MWKKTNARSQSPLQSMTIFTSVNNFLLKLLIFAFVTKISSLLSIIQKLWSNMTKIFILTAVIIQKSWLGQSFRKIRKRGSSHYDFYVTDKTWNNITGQQLPEPCKVMNLQVLWLWLMICSEIKPQMDLVI